MHLRDILVALRARASPVRDAHIDTLLRTLDELSQSALPEDLARLVIDTARSILELADIMKEDLSQFVLGSMEERDLKAVITQQAMLREKALILQLWPPSRVEPAWKTWLNGLDVSVFPGAEGTQPPSRRWVYRLVQALGTNSAVTCPLPATRVPGNDTPEPEPEIVEALPNTLPPPFFVSTPALLATQNYLQALVIAASLRSLVRLPSRPVATSSQNRSLDFMERIWTLLKSSADEEPGTDDTKIVNLADEVVRVRRTCASDVHGPDPDSDEEARLRAAVDRTLQPHDPVFVLLQRRLLRGLATWLVSAAETSEPRPIHMQTGRGRPEKGSRLDLGLGEPKAAFVDWERGRGSPAVIKGFEDEVLVREVQETFGRVGRVVDWTDRIWRDLVESGEIGGAEGADEDIGDDGGPPE